MKYFHHFFDLLIDGVDDSSIQEPDGKSVKLCQYFCKIMFQSGGFSGCRIGLTCGFNGLNLNSFAQEITFKFRRFHAETLEGFIQCGEKFTARGINTKCIGGQVRQSEAWARKKLCQRGNPNQNLWQRMQGIFVTRRKMPSRGRGKIASDQFTLFIKLTLP